MHRKILYFLWEYVFFVPINQNNLDFSTIFFKDYQLIEESFEGRTIKIIVKMQALNFVVLIIFFFSCSVFARSGKLIKKHIFEIFNHEELIYTFIFAIFYYSILSLILYWIEGIDRHLLSDDDDSAWDIAKDKAKENLKDGGICINDSQCPYPFYHCNTRKGLRKSWYLLWKGTL